MEENKAVVEETTKKEQPIKDDKFEKIKVNANDLIYNFDKEKSQNIHNV